MKRSKHYVRSLRAWPTKERTDGLRVVHNHVMMPTAKIVRGKFQILGGAGFRFWLERPNRNIVACDCGFASKLKRHYRYRGRPSNYRSNAK